MLNSILYFFNTIALFALFLSYTAPYISPDTILWPMAFLGLLYPFLLLINSLFLVYWLIRFKKYFWTNLIIILLGYNHIKNLIQIQKSENQSLESSLSIMSFNVRLFNSYQWISKENVKKDIIDFINNEQTDILCIQEFYAPKELPKLHYPFNHIGLQSERKRWRMATYSKLPILEKGTVSIYGEHNNNVCIYSDIKLTKDTIRVYNVHLASNWFQKEDYQFLDKPTIKGAENILERLKSSFYKRAKEVKAIKKHMNKSPYPILLCGDFNDTPNSFAYKHLSEGLLDSFKPSGLGLGQTYNGKFPALRIDYILYSPELSLQKFEIIKKNLSDHYPIIGRFK